MLQKRKDVSDNRSRRGRRSCVIPTKCATTFGTRSFDEMMASDDWEEFVVRYDKRAGKYVMRTACCPGAPVCC